MIKYLFLLMFLTSTMMSTAQDNSTWSTLSMVTFENQFDADWGMDIQIPNFGPLISALEGTEIEVDGFIIPLTGKIKQSHFMLSKLPQSMCFFCGAAGPETAMQVFTAGKKKIAYTDEKIKVRGILRVNDKDMNNPLYTLEDAVVLDD